METEEDETTMEISSFLVLTPTAMKKKEVFQF